MSSISGPGRGAFTDPFTTEATPGDAGATSASSGLACPRFAGNVTLESIAAGAETMARGAMGEAVKLVQKGLADLGFLSPHPGADGIFGPLTQAAVAAFQRAVNLRGTGVVDDQTMNALDTRLTPGAPGSAVGVPGAPAATPTAPPTPTTAPTTPPAPTGVATIPGGTVSGEEEVVEGNSSYSLADDSLYMLGNGQWHSGINREIYTAGYLPRDTGPLNNPIGSPDAPSSVLSSADNTMNTTLSPVQRFDQAMQRATGTPGKLTAKYEVEGKQPNAQSWWGFCDRWSYNALDPVVATHVDKPIQYNGVYFSTAELRGLASFMGRADEGSHDLFKKNVSPLDLEKATTLFLKSNGSGFVSSIWNNSKHPGDYQVWNQPFDSVDQKTTQLQGADAAKVLKDQFGLSGAAAQGKKVYYVETDGNYGVESGDDYEGAANHETRHWKSYILADASGKAIDGKWADGSDDPPEYIWRPDRTGNFTPEAAFFRQLLTKGVPEEKVTAFESALGALSGPVSASQKAQLVAQYKGVAAAYPAADLAKKLAPYGLKPADFQ